MEIISVIGMVLGVAVLIYLTFKGVNGFVASLVGSVIVIVSSGLPFWGTLTGTYAASLGSTFGSYLFLFTIGSAYSELMKKSGAAESIANFLFAFLGVKATVAGTLIITFLLAYGGVNACPKYPSDAPSGFSFQRLALAVLAERRSAFPYPLYQPLFRFSLELLLQIGDC